MDIRDSRYLSQDDGPSFKLHSIPLLSESRGYDDPHLERGDTRPNRTSSDLPGNYPEGDSPASSTEQFPEFEDASCTSPTSRPSWRQLFVLKPSFYAWARRFRLAAEKITDASLLGRSQTGRKRRFLNCLLFLVVFAFLILGVFQFINLTFRAFVALFPDDLDWVFEHWGDPGQPSEGLSHWPTDFTADIRPVACHSHNDYWRKVPLYEAIHAGCIGVEADVWLFDEELYVGHNTYSLTPNRTLKSLYINPILELLQKQNPVTHFQPSHATPPHGVFDTDPSQTLVLLIDFKTSGTELLPYVSSQLEPLRLGGYLTYFNGTEVVDGPITVVGTGNAPFDLLTSNTTYRDIFFDAPLGQMASNNTAASDWPGTQHDDIASEHAESSSPSPSSSQPHPPSTPTLTDPSPYTPHNSYYASASFQHSIGHLWRYRLSPAQLDRIRAQIRGAHDRGLKVRYWDVPGWPRGLRNHVWHVLVREGVDVLNVDDLVGATRRDWRGGKKGWWQ